MHGLRAQQSKAQAGLGHRSDRPPGDPQLQRGGFISGFRGFRAFQKRGKGPSEDAKLEATTTD